jgi:hypothetical protein
MAAGCPPLQERRVKRENAYRPVDEFEEVIAVPAAA